jgi:hypothetical protein
MRKSRPRKILFGVGAVSVCLAGAAVAGVATGVGASAEETPTARELLEACGTQTDTCVFHPDGPPVESTESQAHVIEGTEQRNCTGSPQRQIIKWSETKTEENKVGVKVTAEATFAKVYKLAIETSYEHTWSHSVTEGKDDWLEIRPGHRAWMQRVWKLQTVKGRYEMRFPDRFYGHYIWYLPYESTGPVDEGSPEVEKREEAIQC